MSIKNFKIIPSGRVTGGQANYEFDQDQGLIKYQAEISAKVGFIPMHKSASGEYSIDPELLLSVNIVEGRKIEIGECLLEVLKVRNTIADVSIKVGDTIEGTGRIDTSEQYVVLVGLEVKARVMKMEFDLTLEPVQS